MSIKSIAQNKNLAGKIVLVRADFNVPISGAKVKDFFKIEQSLPTINYLTDHGATVVLISHLGRPHGIEKKLSLKPIANCLRLLLKKTVTFLPLSRALDYKKYFEKVKTQIISSPGGIFLLDNIRFFSDEEKNSNLFAKALAKLGDYFVLDGFAVAHRDAASVSGVAKFLPSYAGLLLYKELDVLSKVMKNPKKPLVVILGGAKVETKIPVLKNLLSKADYILVGGQIATTYLWAKGYAVGGSAVGSEYYKEILKYCSKKKVIVPVDFVVGKKNGHDASVVEVNSNFKIKNTKLAVYDIGPLSIRLFAHYIKQAQTVIWNGAMGVFEINSYKYGTVALADLFAARSKGRAFGVAGGGETNEVIKDRKLIDQIDLVSTGGGAMLEFLSGGKLPGIESLKK